MDVCTSRLGGFLILALSIICPGIFVPTFAQAQIARLERHVLQTQSPTDQELLTGKKDAKPATISGELRIPRPGTDRVPAVLLLHASGGATGQVDNWAREFNALGVADAGALRVPGGSGFQPAADDGGADPALCQHAQPGPDDVCDWGEAGRDGPEEMEEGMARLAVSEGMAERSAELEEASVELAARGVVKVAAAEAAAEAAREMAEEGVGELMEGSAEVGAAGAMGAMAEELEERAK